MRRRLGMRPRREFWDYGELFSVTLLLIWWSVMYRAAFTMDVVTDNGEVYEGWLYGGGIPALWALQFVLSGSIAMTVGCLLDERNRTRIGYGVASMNLAFVTFMSIGIANHTAIAAAQAAARFDGIRTPSNLERDVQGRWEVSSRDEPPDAPRFPADIVLLEGDHDVRFQKQVDPLLLEARWFVEGTDSVRVDLPFARWCGFLCSPGDRTVFSDPAAFGPAAPVVLFDVLSRNPPGIGAYVAFQRWAASVPDADPSELVLRSITEGREQRPVATVLLHRVKKPIAGFDLGLDLARPRADVTR